MFSSDTRTSWMFLKPDDVIQFAGPSTTDACRRKISGLTGLVATFTAGETPPLLGYSSHNVPLSALRSPAAPKFRPSRLIVLLTSLVPKKVHISASGMWIRAMDDWF